MTVYCPMCGSALLIPQSDPRKIDEEVGQVLMSQLEKCGSCNHVWDDKWWEVLLPDGDWFKVDADEYGNAIHHPVDEDGKP